MPDADGRTEFEQAVQADMMVNTMIRIAKDLERVLVALWVSAGILALIGLLAILRTAFGG